MCVFMCVHTCVCSSNRPGLLEEVQLDLADIFVGDVSWFIIFRFLHLSPSTLKTQPLKISKQ